MDVAISGSTGLIGTALAAELRHLGHRTARLVRPGTTQEAGDIRWDPEVGTIEARGLEGIDAIVHLAGVPIGDRRWTSEYKAAIISSRVAGTTLLARTVTGLQKPPAVFASASATGFYGSRADEVLSENAGAGTGFPSEVCLAWEGATQPLEGSGIRLVILRSGNVMTKLGGVLPYMLLPFKLGLGAKFGNGSQWFPWVSLRDEVGAIVHTLTHPDIAGPVNIGAPVPVRNADFTKALGRALRRPTPWRAPAFALDVIAGKERAHEVLLGSQRIEPAVLKATGYSFLDPEIGPALQRIIAEG